MMSFFPARCADIWTGFAVFREARGQLAKGHDK
jgi:hypothetical protein